MTITQAIISGIVQGVTEFFPISSSGHLVVLHSLFGMKKDLLAFDVFLHFGTLVSIVIYFRRDIINMVVSDRTMLKLILIGCVPTFIIGLLFKDAVESLFTNPRFVGISLIATGIFLFAASYFAMYWKSLKKEKPLGTINSLIVGIAQGIAVIPGVSRSGATIGTALIAGVGSQSALKFSFLLALPAVLGANLLKTREIYGNLVSVDMVPFLIGGIAAAITGLVAIKAMFSILGKNLLFLFGIYCIFVGSSILIFVK